jgi:pimeloyl-ACP methyl ester carboxylesterase
VTAPAPAPEALPASDPEPVLLATPAGPLSVTDEGPREGPVVVAVHGIPGSVRDFRYLAPPLLARGVRLIRLDLPGFGATPAQRAAIETVEGRAAVVVHAASALGIERFAVLGHSMGGATALLTGALFPRRVTRVLLVASIGLRVHHGLGRPPASFTRLARLLALPLVGHALVPLSRAQYRRRRFPGVEAMGRADFARHLRAIGATDFDALARAARGELPPVLLASARDDHLVETAISDELAAATRARHVVYVKGGHNIQKTRALELAAEIADFLG